MENSALPERPALEKYEFVNWDDYSQYIYNYIKLYKIIYMYICVYIIWKNKKHVPNDQSEFNNLGTREHPQTSVDLTP